MHHGGAAHPRSRGENVCQRSRDLSGLGSSPLTRGKHDAASGGLGATGLIPAHAGKTVDRAHARGAVRAHPRSRGENSGSGTRERGGSGSSPLTRGKLGLATHAEVPTGLIPAHAGKTRSWARRARARTAHPRSRGENVPREVGEQRGWGSSPLTRGKREGGHPGAARVRLIPAHAGKTLLESKLELLKRAHPRSRGENT